MPHPPKKHALAVAAGLLTLACGWVGRAQPAEQPWTVVRNGSALGILELAPSDSSRIATLKFAPLELSKDRLIPQAWRTVANFPRSTGAWESITARRLSSGAWAIVRSELAGGTNVLQCLYTDADLANLPAPIDQLPELIVGVRLADQKPDERPRLFDVSDPSVVEHAGQVYLIGESYLHKQPPDEYAAWVAPARTVEDPRVTQRTLQGGRIIATGENPRVAKLDGRFIVAVERRQPDVDRLWGRWVRLYASNDLERWEAMPSPPSSFEFYDYDLCVARGALTLVGVVDTSRPEERARRGGRQDYAPPVALVTLVYEPERKSWKTVGTRADSSFSKKTEIHLLPPDATGGELQLVERGPDGVLATRRLAE